MKRYFPAILFVLALLWAASSWRPPRAAPGDFDLTKFGKIPVLVGGRVKPLDTVARNSLLIIHGKQTVNLTNGKQLGALRWLTDTLFNAPLADQYPVFVIQNADVLGLFGWEQKDRKYFSYAELLAVPETNRRTRRALRKTSIGPALRLSECGPQSAQWVSPLPALEEQSGAGRGAKFRDGIGFLRQGLAGGGQGGARTRDREEFRRDQTR